MTAKTELGNLQLSDKAKQILAPWAICGSAMPVAFVTHAAWHGDPAMDAWVGAAAAGVTFGVHRTWKRRHEHTQVLATAIAGAVTGWTALATATSPTGHAMVNSWWLGSFVLSVLWNARHHALRPQHEDDKSAAAAGDLDLSRVGGALTGAVARVTKRKPGRMEAEVQLKPGETAESAQAERGRIASLARLGTDQVTISDVRGRADQFTLAFQDNPDQRQAVRGFVPGQIGRSVADAPLVFGRRADGEDLALWMVGDDDMDHPRQLGHTLCTGMTGSGKTQTLNTLIIRIRETRDMVPVVADPAKFRQSFGTIADALEIAAVDKAQTLRLVRNLPATIVYRSDLLGTLERSDGTFGYEQWEPECWTRHGIPAVFIDIEEATDVLSMLDDEFDDAIRKARSVGMHLCASMQTAPHDNIGRKTRGQFANSLCHGCGEDYDAKFSLTSGTREAGADPVKWKNDYAGSLYAELVGVPREQWATEARAFKLTRAEKRALLTESRPTWAHLDAGTKMHLSAGIPLADAQVTAGLPTVVPDQEPDDQDTAPDLTKVVTDEGEFDVTQPIPAPTGASLMLVPPRTGDKMSAEQAYILLKQRINALEADRKEEVEFCDVSDLPSVTGLSRATIYRLLARLEENGRLESQTGEKKPPYRIRPRVLNGTAVDR